jgi:hypothetical protein
VEGNDHGEAYTAIVRGGLLSRESSNIAEAEAFSVAKSRLLRSGPGCCIRGGVRRKNSCRPPRIGERLSVEVGNDLVGLSWVEIYGKREEVR